MFSIFLTPFHLKFKEANITKLIRKVAILIEDGFEQVYDFFDL